MTDINKKPTDQDDNPNAIEGYVAQLRLFDEGFAAFANGVSHDQVPAYDIEERRRWWLKGWYAAREGAIRGLNGLP
jgi:ribosome modulation factor